MIRSLVLFWGFPNQLSSDSWAVGFEEADHAALWIARRPMGADQRSSDRARRSCGRQCRQTTGCSLMRFFTDIERESLGVIYPRVLATGTSYTSALTDGRRAAFSIAFSSCWRATPTTNT